MPTAILALLGLSALLGGWVLNVVLPEARTHSWAILGVGAALIVAAFVVDFSRVRRALAGRRGRFGVGAAVRVSLFLGIIVLSNAISVANYRRFDLTGLSQFTLTSQTKEALAALDQPVEIVSFFTPGVTTPIGAYAESLLAEYQTHTARLSARSVDPDLSPDEARRYGLDRMGAALGAVIVSGSHGRRRVLGPQIATEAEQALTGAILEVTGHRQRKVLFLTGHGEGAIEGTYGSAARGLRENLFQVGALDLLAVPAVPSDAAALVIAGPRRPAAESELHALNLYLRNGGRVLILLDPDPPRQYRELIAEYGLEVHDGYLVDPPAHVAPRADNLLVTRERNDFGLAELHFPGATAMIATEDVPAGLELSALVWSSPKSWLEKSGVAVDAAGFDRAVDRKGPFAIGALASLTARDDAGEPAATRLVAIGDSDFASDRNFHNGNNSDLFLTAVNWLAEGEEVISIDRRVNIVRRLLLSPQEARFLHLSSIAFPPLVVLLAGGFVFWRQSRGGRRGAS